MIPLYFFSESSHLIYYTSNILMSGLYNAIL